jgi:hypothetical protein
MLDSGSVNPKQLAELQPRAGDPAASPIEPRGLSAEIMERREELQNDQAGQLQKIDELADQLSEPRGA